MTAPRFFCPVPLAASTHIDLPAELAHHAIRVLRLKDGADIVLFDGTGGEYPARLSITGKKGSALTGQHVQAECELKGHITLVQGIAAGDKMDWIIEKAVELGAMRVAPIAARRSVLQLTGERLEKRLQHWNRVAVAASEQCGRNQIMTVLPPSSLQDYLMQSRSAGELLLVCHPDSNDSLAQALSPSRTHITILVGPEGGWAPDELAMTEAADLHRVRFGRRVLRTETAGLALISAISALQGWV
jgi:16S rRNA (uracil1498-N3)-methyltransferase